MNGSIYYRSHSRFNSQLVSVNSFRKLAAVARPFDILRKHTRTPWHISIRRVEFSISCHSQATTLRTNSVASRSLTHVWWQCSLPQSTHSALKWKSYFWVNFLTTHDRQTFRAETLIWLHAFSLSSRCLIAFSTQRTAVPTTVFVFVEFETECVLSNELKENKIEKKESGTHTNDADAFSCAT